MLFLIYHLGRMLFVLSLRTTCLYSQLCMLKLTNISYIGVYWLCFDDNGKTGQPNPQSTLVIFYPSIQVPLGYMDLDKT